MGRGRGNKDIFKDGLIVLLHLERKFSEDAFTFNQSFITTFVTVKIENKSSIGVRYISEPTF
jgi:hypothetical protein